MLTALEDENIRGWLTTGIKCKHARLVLGKNRYKSFQQKKKEKDKLAIRTHYEKQVSNSKIKEKLKSPC